MTENENDEKQRAFNFEVVQKTMQLTMLVTLRCRLHRKKNMLSRITRKATCVQLSSGSLHHATHNVYHTSPHARTNDTRTTPTNHTQTTHKHNWTHTITDRHRQAHRQTETQLDQTKNHEA